MRPNFVGNVYLAKDTMCNVLSKFGVDRDIEFTTCKTHAVTTPHAGYASETAAAQCLTRLIDGAVVAGISPHYVPKGQTYVLPDSDYEAERFRLSRIKYMLVEKDPLAPFISYGKYRPGCDFCVQPRFPIVFEDSVLKPVPSTLPERFDLQYTSWSMTPEIRREIVEKLRDTDVVDIYKTSSTALRAVLQGPSMLVSNTIALMPSAICSLIGVMLASFTGHSKLLYGLLWGSIGSVAPLIRIASMYSLTVYNFVHPIRETGLLAPPTATSTIVPIPFQDGSCWKIIPAMLAIYNSRLPTNAEMSTYPSKWTAHPHTVPTIKATYNSDWSVRLETFNVPTSACLALMFTLHPGFINGHVMLVWYDPQGNTKSWHAILQDMPRQERLRLELILRVLSANTIPDTMNYERTIRNGQISAMQCNTVVGEILECSAPNEADVQVPPAIVAFIQANSAYGDAALVNALQANQDFNLTAEEAVFYVRFMRKSSNTPSSLNSSMATPSAGVQDGVASQCSTVVRTLANVALVGLPLICVAWYVLTCRDVGKGRKRNSGTSSSEKGPSLTDAGVETVNSPPCKSEQPSAVCPTAEGSSTKSSTTESNTLKTDTPSTPSPIETKDVKPSALSTDREIITETIPKSGTADLTQTPSDTLKPQAKTKEQHGPEPSATVGGSKTSQQPTAVSSSVKPSQSHQKVKSQPQSQSKPAPSITSSRTSTSESAPIASTVKKGSTDPVTVQRDSTPVQLQKCSITLTVQETGSASRTFQLSTTASQGTSEKVQLDLSQKLLEIVTSKIFVTHMEGSRIGPSMMMEGCIQEKDLLDSSQFTLSQPCKNTSYEKEITTSGTSTVEMTTSSSTNIQTLPPQSSKPSNSSDLIVDKKASPDVPTTQSSSKATLSETAAESQGCSTTQLEDLISSMSQSSMSTEKQAINGSAPSSLISRILTPVSHFLDRLVGICSGLLIRGGKPSVMCTYLQWMQVTLSTIVEAANMWNLMMPSVTGSVNSSVLHPKSKCYSSNQLVSQLTQHTKTRSMQHATSTVDPLITCDHGPAGDENMPRRKSTGKSNDNKNTPKQSFVNNVHRGKSVRYGASALAVTMPETSRAFIKSVLDPAHAKEYNPTGVPDSNTRPTLTRNLQYTTVMPTIPSGQFIYLTTGGTTSTMAVSAASGWTVEKYYILQTCDAAIDYIVAMRVRISSTSYTGPAWCLMPVENSSTVSFINASTTENSYRVLCKGMTVEQIGQRMYRGGYFTGHQLGLTSTLDDSSNESYRAVSLYDIEDFTVETFNDAQGVYSVLPLVTAANYCKWSHLDANNNLYAVLGSNSSNISSVLCNFMDTPYEQAALATHAVGFVPPMTVDKSTTSVTFALRLTTFVCIEKLQSATSGGVNVVVSDAAAINLWSAINEINYGFYPGSYNDFKQVLQKIREMYLKHHNIVDVAAGVIPYGSTVKGVLDALAGYQPPATPTIASRVGALIGKK